MYRAVSERMEVSVWRLRIPLSPASFHGNSSLQSCANALEEASFAAGLAADASVVSDMSLAGRDLTCTYSTWLKILQQLRGRMEEAD